MSVFSWLTRRGRREIGSVAGFGKVPALGDFVRSPPRSDEMTAFEEWVTGAMALGETRRGAAWREDLEAADTLAFLWGGPSSSKGRGMLAGVIKASHDAVRRAFPIVVCVPLPVAAFASSPHLAPLVLVEFFREAARAAGNAAHARSQAEFQLAVTGPRAPALAGVSAASSTYSTWIKATRSRDLLSDLFATDGAAQPEHAIHTIVDATHPFRGREAPPLSLGVRAPVGAHAETAAALWIDLVRCAAGWSETVPSFFWPLSGTTVLVQLGVEAPPSVLVDLWAPSAQSDAVCELHLAAGAAPRFVAPLPTGASAALADPASMLDSVLGGLAGEPPSRRSR